MSLLSRWSHVILLTLIAVMCLVAVYEICEFKINTKTTRTSPIPQTLFQVSTYQIMAQGNYNGTVTYAELAKHGNFGIGAFNGMDGEMIALNGIFYQIPVDGTPRIVNSSVQTPFAMVTFFQTNQTLLVTEPLNYTELKTCIDNALPAQEGIYAIKIHGTFSYAQTRSVPMQTPPYAPLAEVISNQTVFTLNNSIGTIVGYKIPNYMDDINVSGYHCHYITDDKTAGGHMLDLITQNITIEICQIQQYQIQQLP